jgi:hypothetical protein
MLIDAAASVVVPPFEPPRKITLRAWICRAHIAKYGRARVQPMKAPLSKISEEVGSPL